MSNSWLVEEEESGIPSAAPKVSGQMDYTGSDFEYDVQCYLRSFLDKKNSLKNKQRSKFHQKSFKEFKLCILGAGKSFGDIDAFKERKYMYSVRSTTNNVVLYEINSIDFV